MLLAAAVPTHHLFGAEPPSVLQLVTLKGLSFHARQLAAWAKMVLEMPTAS